MPYGYQNFQPNPYNMGQYGNFNNYNMPSYNNPQPPMNYVNNIQGGFYGKPQHPQENAQPPVNNLQVKHFFNLCFLKNLIHKNQLVLSLLNAYKIQSQHQSND